MMEGDGAKTERGRRWSFLNSRWGGLSFPHLPLLIAGSVDLEIILLGTRRSVRTGSRSLTLNMETDFLKTKASHQQP